MKPKILTRPNIIVGGKFNFNAGFNKFGLQKIPHITL